MKNKLLLIYIFLLSIFIFNLNFGFYIATDVHEKGINDEDGEVFNFNSEIDDDNDGIDDNFEEMNKRDIEIHIVENEIEIESIRRSDKKKDEIRIFITYDEDGISLEIKYRSKFESETEFELEFGILFRGLIEYVDLNENGVFDKEIDQIIQDVLFNSFQPVIYKTLSICCDSTLHYLKIRTKNNIFTAHIYFVEEFAIIENSLITPTQTKIDIEISNFDYINESSQLALYTRLVSEVDYEEKEETEDEKEGYALNEKGVITTINDYTGFFTWNESATIDESSNKILISEIMTDENAQILYINYPHGKDIYHDPKLGIENLLIPITEPFFTTDLIILTLIIGAISIGAAYLVYSGVKHQFPTINNKSDREKYFRKNFQKDKIKEPYNGKLALLILEGENAIEQLSQIENIDITVLPEDFFEIINHFYWEENEKSEFINEMLALSLFERQSILGEMLEKSDLNK